MKITLPFDFPFAKYQMGRLDEILDEQISAAGMESGVLRLKGPESLWFTTIEYEKHLVEDFKEAYQRFEADIVNGLPDEVKGLLPKNEIIIPFNMGKLVIGDWQQLVLFAVETTEPFEIEIELIASDAILGLESMHSNSELQTFDITDIIERSLAQTSGEMITLISPCSTVAVYCLKPDCYPKLASFFERVAPADQKYRHTHSWQSEDVAHSHLRASFIGQALTVEVKDGALKIPEGERLFLTELEKNPMRRDIYFEIWNNLKGH